MPTTGHYNLDDDLSDDETEDAALLAEIQAISGACLPSSPSNTNVDDSSFKNPKTTTASTPAQLDFSDSDDDDELLRRIQQQFGGAGVGSGSDTAEDGGLYSPKPLVTLPPVDSDDEDFDTLRAIQQRFGQYSSGQQQEPESEGNPSSTILNLIENRTLIGGGGDKLDTYLEDGSTDNHTAGFGTSSGNDGDDVCNLNVDMPHWALAFHDAIRKNRSLQKLLRGKMMYVETRLEEVSKLKKRVRTIVEYHIRCRRMIGRMLSRGQDDRMLLISSSPDTSSSASTSFGPHENSRVANYKMAFQVFPQFFLREKWSKKERENLKKGIIQQFQNRLLQNMLNVPEEGHDNLEVDQVMTLVGNVEMTSEYVRDFLPKVDWDLLASMYAPRRSGLECQSRWLNHDDPLINWGNWTHLEDKSLLYNIQKEGINKAVFLNKEEATSLSTSALAKPTALANRTPYQCLTRYQRSLNASLIKREWTPDEDAKLISAVESFGESNWEVISSCMEGRTGPQCSNRWLKTLLPSKQKKGRWSPDEDKQLTIAVKLLGRNNKNWCKIAEFVPGRTQARCRDRWMNCLDPNLKFGEWTKEDDLKLKEAVHIHGFRWSKVALCVPSRTDNHCRRRWEVLFPDEISRVRHEKEVMRKVLPTNFVDREPNRPTLEANDFEPLPLLQSKTKVDCLTYSRKRKRRSNEDNNLLLKTSDIFIFNIPKKRRSQRRRKMCNVLETLSSGTGHIMSQMVERDITPSDLWDKSEAFAVEQSHTGQSLLLPSSSELVLPSLETEEKGAMQRRKKLVSISCGIKKKQTESHGSVSSCKERVDENEINESPSSDITVLDVKKKTSGAQQRTKGKVGVHRVEPKKPQLHAQSSFGSRCNRVAVEESTGEEDLVRREEVSGASSGSAKEKECAVSECNVVGKKQEADRFSTGESEDWERMTLTELRRLSWRKRRSNV